MSPARVATTATLVVAGNAREILIRFYDLLVLRGGRRSSNYASTWHIMTL